MQQNGRSILNSGYLVAVCSSHFVLRVVVLAPVAVSAVELVDVGANHVEFWTTFCC